jgi:hypothetical protein
MAHIQAREWRRFGFGGPPEPWAHDAQRDLDRLAISYYLDVLDMYRRSKALEIGDDVHGRLDELIMTATRHKHEIDYTLRHWATPVERARVDDRLGTLMRIGRQVRAVVEPNADGPRPTPGPHRMTGSEAA